jgi:hypothetical protein
VSSASASTLGGSTSASSGGAITDTAETSSTSSLLGWAKTTSPGFPVVTGLSSLGEDSFANRRSSLLSTAEKAQAIAELEVAQALEEALEDKLETRGGPGAPAKGARPEKARKTHKTATIKTRARAKTSSGGGTTRKKRKTEKA